MTNNRKNVNRYSLVIVNNDNGGKIIIPANEFDKKIEDFNQNKTLLSKIDSMTTNFSSNKDLIHYLLRKYLDPNINYINNYSIYIGYQHGNREQKLGVLNSNYVNLKYFSSVSDTYVDINNPYFQMFYDNFMANIKDVMIFRHLTDKYLNKYIAKMIEDYVYLDILPPEMPLKNQLSRYKVIRGILIGYRSLKEKERLIPLDLGFEKESITQSVNVSNRFKIETEDEFLNTAKNRDEIFSSYGYGLDELEKIDGVDEKVADGLFKTDEEKEYYLK